MPTPIGESVYFKLFVAALGPILTVLLAWAVSQRLAAYWAIRQKVRESAIAAANEFYRHYGEFFAIWKLWNYYLEQHEEGVIPEHTRWDLLQRAASAEAGIETTMVKVATERVLEDKDIEALGKFRQRYQSLRESIRDNRKLDWSQSDHPEYLAFKDCSCHLASLIASIDHGRRPSAQAARNTLRRITSNVWEKGI
jgi:hypothetical protein